MSLPLMRDLSHRKLSAEWMDEPSLDPGTHREALNGLARINWISRSHRPIWNSIRDLISEKRYPSLRVLDIACGGGEVAVGLAQAARNASLKITVDGCDISNTAIRFAQDRAERAGVDCRFFGLDVVQDQLPNDYDVLYTSLFLHHLSNDIAMTLLRRMGHAANKMVVVSDLVRSRVGYWMARWVTRLLTRSAVVHSDGPASVVNAFTPLELRRLANDAGLPGARIDSIWPARMLLVWRKP